MKKYLPWLLLAAVGIYFYQKWKGLSPVSPGLVDPSKLTFAPSWFSPVVNNPQSSNPVTIPATVNTTPATITTSSLVTNATQTITPSANPTLNPATLLKKVADAITGNVSTIVAGVTNPPINAPQNVQLNSNSGLALVQKQQAYAAAIQNLQKTIKPGSANWNTALQGLAIQYGMTK